MRSTLVWIRQAAARWRRVLLAVAAVLFVAGIAISVGRLGLSPDQISPAPVLLVLVVMAPLTLAASAASLQVTARAVGREIGFREAFNVSSVGAIAEILPLPGGAMVRGAALVRAGAGIGESTWIVTLTALLMLSMAALLASAPLLIAGSALWPAFLAVGGGGMVVCALRIARRSNFSLVTKMVGLRLVMLAISVARLSAAFAALGFAVDPADAALFVLSAVLGTATSLVPAGLGVSETIAAALALLVEVPPTAAFLAVALNRLLGLCTSGALALAFARDWRRSSTEP